MSKGTLLFSLFVALFVSLCSADTLNCLCGQQNIGSRIVNGNDTSPNKYPWTVALAYAEKQYYGMFCGGTLINSRWVLTAAHCVQHWDPKKMVVALGAHERTLEGQQSALLVAVDKYIVHEDYKGKGGNTHLHNDIALVRLSEAVAFNEKMSPACLPRPGIKEFDEPNDLLAVGWGRLSYEGGLPERLQEVKLDYITPEKCLAFFPGFMTEKVICVGTSGKDICIGDSGGPITTRYMGSTFVLGAASFSPCNAKDLAGYSRVTSYINWIRNTISDGDYCQNSVIPDMG